jgi:hypothetical protein
MYTDEYWYWTTIPPQFKRYICQCENYKPGYDYKLELPICRVCSKLPKYFLRKCTSCNKLFLKDFHSPSFCVLNPQCWNCLDIDAPMCKHVPRGLVSCVDGRGIRPPQIRTPTVPVENFSFDTPSPEFLF